MAGQEVLLSERPNGLSLSAPVQLPAGSVDNQGRIVADGKPLEILSKYLPEDQFKELLGSTHKPISAG